MLRAAREYFAATRALEVETPALSAAAVTDVHIASVEAIANGRRGFLHTSPEYAMKRLLAAGCGDIWQIGKVYRDGESGRWHNPEFTMIEWYRVGYRPSCADVGRRAPDQRRAAGVARSSIAPSD